MEPMVAARLLQAARSQPQDAALVVGAGVGYEAALLALLARSVVALEEDPELARIGRSRPGRSPNRLGHLCRGAARRGAPAARAL